MARAGEFYERRMRMTYPNEFWPAGRPARTTPLYNTFREDNAVFGVSDGLEMPMSSRRSRKSRSKNPASIVPTPSREWGRNAMRCGHRRESWISPVTANMRSPAPAQRHAESPSRIKTAGARAHSIGAHAR